MLVTPIVRVLARSPEYPQRIRVVSVFEPSVCLIVLWLSVSKFSNFFLFHPPLFIQYSTEECSTVQLLAHSPEYPQRIRVASVFEPFVCLIVLCLFFVCLQIFSFVLWWLQIIRRENRCRYKCMVTWPYCGRWGGGWDGSTFDAKYLKYIKAVGPLHPALHRNGA